MRPITLSLLIPILFFQSCAQLPGKEDAEEKGAKEKTVFQTSNPWKPVTEVRADVAIVYSVKDHHGKADMSLNSGCRPGEIKDTLRIL